MSGKADKLISMQAAIEEFIKHCYPVRYDYNSVESGMTLTGIKQVINEMLPAQPEIIRCKDCKHWRQQTNYQGAPISFGSCESEDMWASLYGETTEVEDINTDDNHYCGYAERRTDERFNQ